MTSVTGFIKTIPSDARNFVPVSSLAYNGGINTLTESTRTFATASWAGNGTAGSGSRYTSSINGPGAGKLRDMGKTYVSSSRVFRKVQLIVPNAISTFGVEGQSDAAAAASTTVAPYLDGYIELGWEGAGTPAPVARAP